MADDTLSMTSQWNTFWGVEQLGSKLMKTREHLKKAITHIVELEKKDVSNTERINELELTNSDHLQVGSTRRAGAK